MRQYDILARRGLSSKVLAKHDVAEAPIWLTKPLLAITAPMPVDHGGSRTGRRYGIARVWTRPKPHGYNAAVPSSLASSVQKAMKAPSQCRQTAS